MVAALCGGCERATASVYCFDESLALCIDCDYRIHSSNKAARAHERVPLAAQTQTAMCDICQDAPAVLFCSEDRAVICRECDYMIHTANELTAKHSRHILFQVSAGLKALPPPGPAPPQDASHHASDSASTATQLAKGKQVQHEGPGVGVATRQGGRRHQQPHPERAQQSQHAQQATLARLASDNLITSSNANAGLNGGALFTGVESSAMPASSPFAQTSQLSTARNSQPSVQANGIASSSSALPTGFSTDFGDAGAMNLWYQPSTDAVTRAGDVLGMPHLDGYTAKDIDVAYATDPSIFDDFDADLTSLLEVPDLDFPSSQDFPQASYRDSAFASSSARGGGPSNYAGSFNDNDFAVPDMEPSLKRQRK